MCEYGISEIQAERLYKQLAELEEINTQLLEACEVSRKKFVYLIEHYQLRASIEHEVRNIVSILDTTIAAATGGE